MDSISEKHPTSSHAAEFAAAAVLDSDDTLIDPPSLLVIVINGSTRSSRILSINPDARSLSSCLQTGSEVSPPLLTSLKSMPITGRRWNRCLRRKITVKRGDCRCRDYVRSFLMGVMLVVSIQARFGMPSISSCTLTFSSSG